VIRPALLAALLLTGCAVAPIRGREAVQAERRMRQGERLYNYPELGVMIYRASEATVRELCPGRVRCCFIAPPRLIVALWDAVDCIVHELCHANEPKPKPDHLGPCGQIHWDEGRVIR